MSQIMSYQDWYANTGGTTRSRSSKLLAVDNALLKYEGNHTPEKVIDLWKALKEWMNSKGPHGGWKMSYRNQRGAVNALVMQALEQGQNRHLGPWCLEIESLIPPAPSPSLSSRRLGALVSGTGVDCHRYEFYKQSDENSCGPACVAIVFKCFFLCSMAPHTLEAICEIIEGYITNLGGGPVERSGRHDWGNIGFAIAKLPDVFNFAARTMGISSRGNGLSQALTPELCERLPVITAVTWGAGGNHFVVVAKKAGTQLVILDPYYGVQTATINTNRIERYQPAGLSAQGSWYPWVCQILPA